MNGGWRGGGPPFFGFSSQVAADGGAQLIVPPGKWLTGSFNLTSHFTLFVHKDAVILGSQDESEWPHVALLPSYGLGRDAPGGRLSSLIFGTNLTDVVITVDSPNTDGIDPDSCMNTRIDDSFVVSGDDCIAVKSGWDEYGIKFNMPTKQLVIRRFTCISPSSAAIALGSEMSGGIEDVRAEDIKAINTESGVRIKTGGGRGAYVKNIYVRNMTLNTMKYVFWMTGDYGSHLGDQFDPNAFPVIEGINYRDIVADNVTLSAQLDGIGRHPFTDICISNVDIKLTAKPKEVQWNCTEIQGVTNRVSPEPCGLLPQKEIECPFPKDRLPIEDVELKTCSISANF
ncbi:putative polygalacturonase [Hibiscus syriacus]|uniref:Polygalacturonase n=1 Tax=Hibiscus syriacus TaxID=106335 RepID=A0A6A3CX11_HIBSY|nr:putative polygalacturonase [Hibiscus syriacus]